MQAALGLDPMPLNAEDWNISSLVEDAHEGMLVRNLKLLSRSKKGGPQWNEIMEWLNTPFNGTYPPLAFVTCCKVCGIEDPEQMRRNIYKQLGLTEA